MKNYIFNILLGLIIVALLPEVTIGQDASKTKEIRSQLARLCCLSTSALSLSRGREVIHPSLQYFKIPSIESFQIKHGDYYKVFLSISPIHLP
ncbi:hypothetical protein [Sphingobacterium pedocola]|nr:hypothetical protein [Sphingobacterium pedocola]